MKVKVLGEGEGEGGGEGEGAYGEGEGALWYEVDGAVFPSPCNVILSFTFSN
jgi:hypothetical protein